MNRNCKNSFDTIIGSASAYRSAIAKVLNDFSVKEQQARADASQYKDEDGRYKQSLARLTAEVDAQLAENRTGFVRDVTDSVESLKKELHSLALERPNPIYADMLRNYGDFGVKPTLTEIEALLEVNAGCLAGVPMLNSVLARVGSDFHIDGCDIAALEKDVENLSRLGELAEHYAPVENHSQICKVYAGTPRLGANGADTGAVWDSVSLIMARAAFESAVESVGAMSRPDKHALSHRGRCNGFLCGRSGATH